MTKKQEVLIIVGPTSSGKSALAVELAKRFDGEVISADSRQVYRGLDIGTGKVTKREMQGIRHHLLDITSAKKAFSAGDFVARARCAIADIAERGKLPIIAGGTGFYIDALTGRTQLPAVPPDPRLRKKLSEKTAAQLFALLKKEDPARAAAMDTSSECNNKPRLIRALEVSLASQVGLGTKSDFAGYGALWIGIAVPLSTLEKKIAVRLTARLKRGMIAEAKRLHAQGLSYKRMKELGLEYRSLAGFLQGEITRDQLTAELNCDIRRYAKRQMRYWKRNREITWITPAHADRAACIVRAWLRK